MARERIDRLVSERGLAPSRERAQALVLAGRVRVDGQRVDKVGTRVAPEARVEVLEDPIPHVSRGGMKLQAALDAFAVDVQGRTVLDVGASTGGFTDCLLAAGAACVVALDVGHGQLDWGLRNDPRVIVVERCNARYLDPDRLLEVTGGQVSADRLGLAVADVSFISVTKILPAVATLSGIARALVLLKPQFEVGRGRVGKGGIVRDRAALLQVLDGFPEAAAAAGWRAADLIPSPVTGAGGNREFLVDLRRDPAADGRPEQAYLAAAGRERA